MKKLILLDSNALIHRAYHALPKFTARDGRPTGALYGVASILIKVFKESKPDYIVAVFDRPERTFREELSVDYKATRKEPDNDLVLQIVEAYNLFKSFTVRTIDAPGFEADDVIGSLVEKFKKVEDLQVVILTGDLDSLQLVEGEKVVSQVLKKGVSETVIYDENAVYERFKLKPSQLIDYKALVGDVSDNIPRVPGVGPKTAVGLIEKYGSLEKMLQGVHEEDIK